MVKGKPGQNINTAQAQVLVVDDHPQMRKAILRILTPFNFAGVHEAANGSEALKILRENPIDLVICDLYLFDVSGFDVLEFVRNRDVNNDIPFIVVTGEGSKEEIVKAADRGANDYLLKPFRSEDLEGKIETLLGSYQNPPEIVKLIRQAERAFIRREFKDALSQVEQVLTKDPSSVSARYLKALVLDKAGHSDAAIKLHTQNVDQNPNYYRSYAALAEIFLRENRGPEAIDAIIHELELNPRQPKRQTQLATLLLESGKIDQAINHFREALKENVKYLYALFGMGKAYAAMGNLDKAIYYYKRVRRYYPTNTKSLEAIVKSCMDQNEVKKAEFTLRDEKNANKNRLDTYLVLAKLYLASDERDKAIAILDELLLLKADSVPGLKLKAAIHMKYNELQPAMEIYEELLQNKPDAETFVQYSDILMKAGRFLEAAAHLYEAIKSLKNSEMLFTRFVTCYAKTNQHMKSIFILNKLNLGAESPPHLKAIRDEARRQVMSRRSAKQNKLAS